MWNLEFHLNNDTLTYYSVTLFSAILELNHAEEAANNGGKWSSQGNPPTNPSYWQLLHMPKALLDLSPGSGERQRIVSGNTLDHSVIGSAPMPSNSENANAL